VSPEAVPKIGKSERTRAAILNAALDFVWSHPYRDMTVASLMTSTGVSRSAFYQYFSDLHEVMETLLTMLQEEIFTAVEPWLAGVRAITDAASANPRLEEAWLQFLAGFDDAATARIEADQKQGLIPDFEARPVAYALNRLDAYTVLQAFGKHPRKHPEPVLEALTRIWTSTLYGADWLGKESSDLVRN
jgi:AcrR family transcriptional regulator